MTTYANNHNQQEELVLALGMFDGVHGGHLALLQEAASLARAYGIKSAAHTFDSHPKGLFGKAPALLNTSAERRQLLLNAGVDAVYTQVFTPEFAALSPEEFLETICIAMKIRALVVGFNYTFGHKGAGTSETLQRMEKRYSYETHVVPPVLYAGEPISSSRIRDDLESGQIAAANAMLGYPYTFFGDVVANKQIGTDLGFPTANILPPPGKVLPQNGVYSTGAFVDGRLRAAVTNIGTNPTVGGTQVGIETNILDYTGNLYGKTLHLRFYERIRAEKTFSGKEALKAQIARDVSHAKTFFETHRIGENS